MKESFKAYIKNNNLLKETKKILLAVSGGPDSMAMLDLFLESKKTLDVEIAVAHLNHMFREESEEEAEYLRNFLKNNKIKLYYKKVNLPKLIKQKNISAEAAARKERFKFFQQIIDKYNFDLLALAHHRDDQAETILLNLFRGAGLEGLSGIQPSEEVDGLNIIHPMLNFNKKEILVYCKKNNLNPKFDKSNKDNIYSRNIIRNEIFPLVEKNINENAKEVIARNSKLIAKENKFLQNLAVEKYESIVKFEDENKVIIDIEKFKNINKVLQRRIYRHIYKILNNNLDDFYFDHILEIEKILYRDKTGVGIDISAGIRAEISYSNLVFLKNSSDNQLSQKKIKIDKDKIIEINEKQIIEIKNISKDEFSFTQNLNRAAFDYNKLKKPLFIRSRKAGDKMIPLGMQGHKKVKDILIDKKIPKYDRDKVPLIVDAEENIIWLVPYKISENHKVDQLTERVLLLELKNK